jgi:hypothetical protein
MKEIKMSKNCSLAETGELLKAAKKTGNRQPRQS